MTQRVAVFLPNWIGDVVMATPTLRALRRHYGADGELIGVMRPYVRQVLQGSCWLTDSIYFDPSAADRRYHSLSVADQLRQRQVDSILLLPNSFRAASIAWLSGAA